jgi:hypothetical protein
MISALGPLIVFLKGDVDFSSSDYRVMSRESAQISPSPQAHPEALVQAFVARTFNWRGPFAVHSWIAVKPKNADHYTVYEVIGFRLYQGLSVVSVEKNLPDRYWYGNKPELILNISGKEAEALIPQIDKAAREYPYTHDYHYWPGPNSNTFIAMIAKDVPKMQLALPGTAIGKDYLPLGDFFAPAPSGTGYQFSIGGLFSITLAKIEGLEINIIGLVFGISPYTRTLKWPGIGNVEF